MLLSKLILKAKTIAIVSVLAISVAGLAAEAPREVETCASLIDRGKFDEARERLAKYRRSNPDDPHGLMLLARLEQDVNISMAVYREAELLALMPGKAGPDSALAAEALYQQAEIMFSDDDAGRAVELYERLVLAYPASARFGDAVYRLGVINLVSGEPRKALEKFRTCLAKYDYSSGRARAAAGKMECYVVLKDWPEVLASAREVLDESDENSAVTPRVLEVIALAWTELGNSKNAEWYTERLLADYPDSYQAHAARVRGSTITGNLALEQTDASDAVDDAPETPGLSGTVHDSPPGGNIDNQIRTEPSAPSNAGLPSPCGYTVQAGAFRDRINARKMYEKLVAAGIDARVELKDVAGTHFYKVLAGKYRTRSEADDMIDRVSRATGEKANVIIME